MPENKDIKMSIDGTTAPATVSAMQQAASRRRRDWRSTRLWTPVLLGLTLAFMEAGSLTSLWRLHEVGWFDIAVGVVLVILWPLLMEAHTRDAAHLARLEGWHEGFTAARERYYDQKDTP